MDVNFEEDQEWEEQAVVIAKRVEEEYQKEKLRSNQMQQNEDESTVRNPRGFLRIRFPRKDNNTLHHGYMDILHAYCMKYVMSTTIKIN